MAAFPDEVGITRPNPAEVASDATKADRVDYTKVGITRPYPAEVPITIRTKGDPEGG